MKHFDLSDFFFLLIWAYQFSFTIISFYEQFIQLITHSSSMQITSTFFLYTANVFVLIE